MDLLASKIVSLLVIFSLTTVCGLCPIKLSQVCTGRKGQLILCLLHCFAGGVFLGTFLLHLFPEVAEDVGLNMAAAQEVYPIAESLVAGGFFFILTMEQVVMIVSKIKDDNLAEALKEPSLVKGESSKPPAEESSSLTEPVKNADTGLPEKTYYGAMKEEEAEISGHAKIRKTRAAVLVFALSLHSIFEGMALGLQKKGILVWSLMAALSTHKMVMAFSMGLQLITAFKPALKPVITCILTFAVVSPVGIIIGTIITEAPHSHAVLGQLSCALEGIAAGSFLYVSFFEILVPEIRNKEASLLKVLFIFIGFMCMAGLRFLHPEHS